MYNKGLVIIGVAVFLGLMLSPFIYNLGVAVLGVNAEPPKLVLPPNQTQCVETADWMRDKHMQLLDQWREAVVREGKRIYTSKTLEGKQFNMSLQNTCMQCHSNKAEFCDKCHNYTSVNPYCWDCHVEPKEMK